MTRIPALIGAAALALSLGACASLIPREKAALYRFGQGVAADAPAGVSAGQVGVLRAGGFFQREAAGDKLLTVSGGKAAYIAETRWAAPASVMWDQAVLAAFDADPGPARLISRGEPGPSAYILRLDVRNFETRYDRGPRAAPEVVVRVRAALTRTGGGPAVEQIFESRARAAANRVGAIVPAYDKAVAEVLTGVVAWVNQHATPVA